MTEINVITAFLAFLGVVGTYVAFYIGRKPILDFETEINEADNEFNLYIYNYGGPAKLTDFYIDYSNSHFRKSDLKALNRALLNDLKKENKENNLGIEKFRHRFVLFDPKDSMLLGNSSKLIMEMKGMPLLNLVSAIGEIKTVVKFKSTLPLDLEKIKVYRMKFRG